MTYPGEPYNQPPLPSPDGQKGITWALIGFGAFLVLVLVVVGGYFTFQKIFVQTPSEVVQSYLTEAVKDDPQPATLEKYLCQDEAAKLERDLSNHPSGGSSGSPTKILDWHVTGESVNGNTADVATAFTVKDTTTSRTENRTLTLTLIKESGAWKICGYAV